MPTAGAPVRPINSAPPLGALVGTVTSDGVTYPVYQVRGDGDCFYTAVIQGAGLQGVDNPLIGGDITGLRRRAAAHVEGGDDVLGHGLVGDPVEMVVDDIAGV